MPSSSTTGTIVGSRSRRSFAQRSSGIAYSGPATRKSRARVVQYVGFCTIIIASMWGIEHLPEGYDEAAFYGTLVVLPLWGLFGPGGWQSRRPSART